MAGIASGVVPLIPINRDLAAPLHRQVYAGLRDAILRGGLMPGQQVPSSRALALALGVSRYPVLDAYSQLSAEGYFESRVGAGTFVAASLSDHRRQTTPSVEIAAGARPVSRRISLFPRFQDVPWRFGWGAFAVHQPAIDQFPFEVWSKLVARNSRSPRLHAFHHIDPCGLRPFREAICAYLSASRAVRCHPDQIMVVSGSQQALDITARVLLNPGDRVWIEEPCYPLVRSILMGAGCHTVPVPVDEEGMSVAYGIKRAAKARAAFVTPSHHYPLGVTMSVSRRLQLLHWAVRSSAWIVEDDYDSEFRFESQPVASLQGLDTAGRVIYIGTFSKVLYPSLRLGYIVIPPDLVEHFMAVRFAMDIFPPYLFQEVLTDFMSAGHFVRHIRRMRAVYKARRAALVESLHAEFGGLLEIHGSAAGMHLAVTLPAGRRDRKIAMQAAQEKLWLWPLSPCWSGSDARQGFILGYGNTPEENVRGEVARLHEIFAA
ncbi:MAG TPA: PLP-dependent aminotransferase family protein [Terracidiphilus sp.]|nr:PLP-dependent aminotransferase family protein [Terracidiphilus sp.]